MLVTTVLLPVVCRQVVNLASPTELYTLDEYCGEASQLLSFSCAWRHVER